MRRFAALAVISLLICACASRKPPELPRAQPAFLQWMMRQSLQAQAEEMIAEVSQTARLWMNNGKGHPPSLLLSVAPSWFEVNARAFPSRRPLLIELASSVESVSRLGFSGIYLGPTGERPEIWVGHEVDSSRFRHKRKTGHDAASIKFDPAVGTEEDFARLAARAEASRLQLGSDLLDAATGVGPDFLLACRKAAGYTGLYAMMEAPEDVLDALPEVEGEWDFSELDGNVVETLVEKAVLPKALARDGIEWGARGGWAVTGPVTGVDGRRRRWLYRFSGDASRPVMLWQDPSAAAKRVFSADIIASTGLNRESLVGIRLEPLIGLEAAPQIGLPPEFMLEPALLAINEMAAEVHRYGGWAIQSDGLPLYAMECVLDGGCDFCRDALTPALVAAAILTGDPTLLGDLYGQWLEDDFDQSRLGRGLNDWEGIDPRLLAASFADTAEVPDFAGLEINQDGRISLDEIFGAAFSGEDKKGRDRKSFYDMLLAWRLGLPGLAFLNSAELEKMGENLAGAFTPPRNAIKNFSASLGALLKARRDSQLANGAVCSLAIKEGAIGIASELPEGGYWVMACNFGKKRESIEIDLPARARSARDAASGANLSRHLSGTKLRLSLDGQQARHVLLQGDKRPEKDSGKAMSRVSGGSPDQSAGPEPGENQDQTPKTALEGGQKPGAAKKTQSRGGARENVAAKDGATPQMKPGRPEKWERPPAEKAGSARQTPAAPGQKAGQAKPAAKKAAQKPASAASSGKTDKTLPEKTDAAKAAPVKKAAKAGKNKAEAIRKPDAAPAPARNMWPFVPARPPEEWF